MNYNILPYRVLVWNALCEYAKIYDRDFQCEEDGWIKQVKNLRPTLFKKFIDKNLHDFFIYDSSRPGGVIDGGDINIVIDSCSPSEHIHQHPNTADKYYTKTHAECDLDINQLVSISDNYFNKMFKKHYFHLFDCGIEVSHKTIFLKHRGLSDYDLTRILESIIPKKMLNIIGDGFCGLGNSMYPKDREFDKETIDSIKNFIFRNVKDKN